MKTRLDKNHWLLTRPCAHRGLHGNGVSENSERAFELAIENDYPIELDVQMTADDKLIVIHDDDMFRLTGVRGDVRQMTFNEVRKLRLSDGQGILSFEQFLSLVAGRVPLLIEIKQQKRKGVENLVLNALNGYKGEFVIQSFDPLIMYRIKKLAPDIIRGQLGGGKELPVKGIKAHIVKNMSLNFLVKPDFVNYHLDSLPVKKSVTNGLPILGWTVRNEEQLSKARKYCVSFVFENVTP